jgi:hypothetical protein
MILNYGFGDLQVGAALHGAFGGFAEGRFALK